MNYINKDDLAFPFEEHDSYSGEISVHHEGLTKREYFAAKVLQGILSSGRVVISTDNKDSVSAIAVSYTDALIEELNKG